MTAIKTTVPVPLDQAEATIRAALADQGFGVRTEIDVAATLKAKLGVDRPALKCSACATRLQVRGDHDTVAGRQLSQAHNDDPALTGGGSLGHAGNGPVIRARSEVASA